jgi:hypothetical protein
VTRMARRRLADTQNAMSTSPDLAFQSIQLLI